MSAPEIATGVYLDTLPAATFALYNEPQAAGRRDTSVLICAPFGWEDHCSYRGRREWAITLARGGYPTARLDLQGSGDSEGFPDDPNRLDAWTTSITATADWLRADPACDRVAAVGIGMGGWLALRAVARGLELDDLVLWAVPSRGKRILRELRTFASLNASVDPDAPDLVAPSEAETEVRADDGSLAVGGFLLSAETVASLDAGDLGAESLPKSERNVLMIERDGISVEERLRAHLEASGAAVRVIPGNGYSAMMAIPQEATVPHGEIAAVSAWLDERSVPARATNMRELPAEPRLELNVGGARVSETPITIDQPTGKLFGVLTEPATGTREDLCAVFLNAGAIPHHGPNRMWVEAARRWATRGVTSLRLDLEGIGESDGEGQRYRRTADLYVSGLVQQVVGALDALETRELPNRFLTVGLCSGAYWAFHTARRDDRAVGSFMLNPRGLVFDEALDEARWARMSWTLLRRVATGSRQTWKRILRGEASLKLLFSILKAAMLDPFRRRQRKSAERVAARELDGWSAGLDAEGKDTVFLFCDNEPYRDELEVDGYFERIAQWPTISVGFLPGGDHTLRPLRAQTAAHDAIDAALSRLLKAGAKPGENGAVAGTAEPLSPSR